MEDLDKRINMINELLKESKVLARDDANKILLELHDILASTDQYRDGLKKSIKILETKLVG